MCKTMSKVKKDSVLAVKHTYKSKNNKSVSPLLCAGISNASSKYSSYCMNLSREKK